MKELKHIANLDEQARQVYYLNQVLKEAQAHASHFPEWFDELELGSHYRAIDEHVTAMRNSLKRKGAYATWPSPHKLGIGTAQTYDSQAETNPSRLWFTIAEGGISEVMYPTLDELATKSLSFIVSDGSSFVHNVSEDCISTIRLLDKRALAYEVVSIDPDGRYRLVQEIVTDPNRNTLLIQVRLEAQQGDRSQYKFYLHWVPYLGKFAWSSQSGRIDLRKYVALTWNKDHIATLRTEPRWIDCMAGVPGDADSLALLRQKNSFAAANENPHSGRISFTFELPRTDTLTVALDFQPLADMEIGPFIETLPDTFETSRNPRGDPNLLKLPETFDTARRSYINGWNNYCSQLNDLQGQATDFYYLSAMAVKAHMDKTHQGAVLASLCMPWGPTRLDSADTHGYRQVWARDLYHAAMSLLAAGDHNAAKHVLDFMNGKLQQSDGGFPQTAGTNGKANWVGIQLDQVAGPILLAWWMNAIDKYESMVKPAADFLVRHGPSTPMERWEENAGYSPSTLAAEIAALICAADLAERANDLTAVVKYRTTADDWHSKIDNWCFTTNGPWPSGEYYLRISPSGDPNVGEPIRITNGGGWFDQRLIVDPSFLELVRLGLKRADDPRIRVSLNVVDRVLKRATMKGASWYRYNGDGYGEINPQTSAPGRGHLWPLLTGERGMFEVAHGNLVQARELLDSLEKMANAGGMIPEQIWEGSGDPTGAATPLVWAHAEYIILLRSIVLDQVVDMPAVVWNRYAAQKDQGNSFVPRGERT